MCLKKCRGCPYYPIIHNCFHGKLRNELMPHSVRMFNELQEKFLQTLA